MRVSGIEHDLSEEYVIQCSGQGNCTHAPGLRNLRKTLNFIIKDGIPRESDVPYKQYFTATDKIDVANACNTTKVKWLDLVKNHGSFGFGYHNFRDVIKQGPSTSGMYASANFWQYKGGIFKCTYN